MLLLTIRIFHINKDIVKTDNNKKKEVQNAFEDIVN